MRLPRAPKGYDQNDQAVLRTTLEQEFVGQFKSGQDVQLLNGEKLVQGFAASLTAHAGGGQASALKLTAQINHLSTVASAADSVALPPAIAGRSCTVINRGANAAQVFGLNPDTINGVATGTGVSQASNTVVTYFCPAAGAWFA